MPYRTRPFALSLARPLSTSRGEITSREGILVGVADDDAGGDPLDPGAGGNSPDAASAADPARGVGEATPLPGWTESLDACRRALASIPDDAVRGDRVPADRPPAGLDGLPAAAHGLQQAALDRAARRAGKRLAALLAAEHFPDHDPPERVPVNATVGDGDAAETVAAAEAAVEAGFECLKVKVGARPLAADLDRVRAVGESVGDDVAVRLDANGAWDRETAGRAVDALGGLGIDYVEQPLPAADLDGLAALRGRGVGIAVDESLATAGVDAVLDAGAADAAICKPMALGGPGTAARVAATLRARGVEPVVTTTIDGALARAAAVHVAAAIPDVAPCGLATGGLLDEDLLADPAPVENGRVRVPGGPGTVGDAADGLLW